MSTSIGETLRKAREARGLALADAAAQTCIRERYLRALENEEFAALGEGVYAKGFLRSYAKALGLDPAPLLGTYKAEYEQPPPDEAALTGQVLHGEELSLPRGTRLTAGAGTIVLVFALLAAVGLNDDAPNAATPIDAPDERLTAGVAEAPLADSDGDSDAEPAPTDDPEPEPTPTPEPERTSDAAREGVQVHVEVDGGDSWVRVVVDGDVAFEGIKPQGATATFSGDEEVFLRIGNAGVVLLTVNGEDQGTAGGSGEVVEYSYRTEDRSSA